MPWLQLRIETTPKTAEQIGNIMSTNGAQAVTFLDAKDSPQYEPKPGEIMLWPETIVVGLFDASDDMPQIIKNLGKARVLGANFKYRLEPLEDKDWEREWMDNFHPMQFGERLWICPSWRDVPDPDAVNVMLDPGLAFGTGTHETTALCLRWLDKQDLRGKVVIDFGCGSGILGIAALKLGAARVIGIDIDPQALQASQANADRNGVGEQIELYLPDAAPDIQGDYVLANILAATLRDLKPIIDSYCKLNGKLVMSGILDEQVSSITDLYQATYQLEDVAIDGDWARVSGEKTNA